MITCDHKAAKRFSTSKWTHLPEIENLKGCYLDAIDTLREVLRAERISNRPPETVMQAEAKLDAIRKAAKRASAILGDDHEMGKD